MACINKVGTFICIGLNDADHAEESGMPISTEPEVFSKFSTSISGPNDDLVKPKASEKLGGQNHYATTSTTISKC